MAEEGIVIQSGQPIIGMAYGKQSLMVPVGVNYARFLANTAMSAISAKSGATGDWLAGILISPTSTTVGQVFIQDGSSSANSALILGNGTLADLKPFYVPLGIRSTQGSWQMSTSAGVVALAVGAF